MHGNLNYSDVVNQVREQGWTIVSQTPDATHIEQQVGAPRIPAIALALVPVVGMLLALLWIYTRGTIQVSIERHRNTARIVTKTNTYDINRNNDLETFFSLHSYDGNIGYYPILITGIIVTFILFVVFQMTL
jgi:hypothetical protein